MQDQQNSPDLPCDVVEDILSRLPVKSLLRLKAVCRSWKDMINDPRFARLHCNRLVTSDSQCTYATNYSGVYTYSLMEFQGLGFYEESKVPRWEKHQYLNSFLCACEGILVFQRRRRESREEKYELLNPFTRRHFTFACPYQDVIRANSCVTYGLCIDKYEDDYKFIVVLKEGKYLVYSIKNDRWVERQNQSKEPGCAYGPGVYAKGLVCWCAAAFSLLYFDPRDDSLKKLHRPKDLEPDAWVLPVNFRGDLCLYSHVCSDNVWLLKEDDGGDRRRGCWTKLTRAECPLKEVDEPAFFASRLMHFRYRNNIVYLDIRGRIQYSVHRMEIKETGGADDFPTQRKMFASTCVESLCFPATGKPKYLSNPSAIPSLLY